MTTDSTMADGDPRRMLTDVRALARQVRHDQRGTWVALLILGVVTLLAIPFDWYFLEARCSADGTECYFSRQGPLYFWPPALLMAYAAIAVSYVRIARARGVGARVMPYAFTGAALTVVFTVAWLLVRIYLEANPRTEPFPDWVMVLDRLITPAGTIGLALLVLARLERNIALLVFSLGYLAVVVVPINFGWGAHWGIRTMFLPQQVINGTVLLLGAVGFAMARRRQR